MRFLIVLSLASLAFAKKCPMPQREVCNPYNQMSCSLGTDDAQCDLGNSCSPMQNGDCPAVCPCTQGQLACMDNAQQCPTQSCLPAATTTSKGNQCQASCPTICQGSDFQCPPTYDSQGCPEAVMCAAKPEDCAKSMYEQDTGCPVIDYASVDCGSDAVPCAAVHDGQGCLNLPMPCAPKIEECPKEEFDSNGCQLNQPPVQCSEGQVPCPPAYDERQCVLPQTCIPEGDNLNTCIMTCPMGQQLCPLGTDPNGGSLGNMCMPAMNPDGCAAHCPVTCAEGEVLCPGTIDPEGCTGMDTCMPAGGECPKSMYDSNGCQIPETDMPEGQIACPGAVDALGCQMPRTLVPAVTGDCPGICPANCDPLTQMECPGQPDANGCPSPPTCITKIWSPVTKMECPMLCPPSCVSGQETSVHQGMGDDGCDKGFTCQPIA